MIIGRVTVAVDASEPSARIWCQEGHKVIGLVFISFVVIRPNSTIQ